MRDIVQRLREHNDQRLYREADLLMFEASNEIESLRAKLAAAEKDAERYRHILRQQWHGHISNLSGTRTFEEYVEHINKLRDEAMAKEKE